jgi:hypothetical protein
MWAWVVGGSDNAGTWKPLCKITFRLFVQAVHAPKWVSRLDLSPNPKISHVDIWEIWKYFKIPKGLKSKLLLGPSILDKRPLNCIFYPSATESSHHTQEAAARPLGGLRETEASRAPCSFSPLAQGVEVVGLRGPLAAYAWSVQSVRLKKMLTYPWHSLGH